MELKKIAGVFCLGILVSLDAAAYTAICKKNYNRPWIEVRWNRAESTVFNYYFVDYEFTYMSTGQYWSGDFSYWVPFDRADSSAIYVNNPMAGTWGLDGATHMGKILLNPFTMSAGHIENCSGDIFI